MRTETYKGTSYIDSVKNGKDNVVSEMKYCIYGCHKSTWDTTIVVVSGANIRN